MVVWIESANKNALIKVVIELIEDENILIG